MNRIMISAIASALFISPLAVNAVQLYSEANNDTQLQSPVTQLAQNNPNQGKRRGRHRGMKKVLGQLDLSPEQSQQIEAIREQFHSDNENLFQEMRTNHEQLRSLLASEASKEQLRQQHQSMQNLRQQLDDKRFETMLQVRDILTPEQRAQMAELMEQKRGRRGFPNFGN